jgi:hypothetical protein
MGIAERLDAQVPPDLDVHIIMDNYATQKTALVRTWLARRPHCTAVSGNATLIASEKP